jgi:hypothetical protein
VGEYDFVATTLQSAKGATTAPFATTILIVDGTRRFAGATGTFVDRGVSDPTTGGNSGSYIAQICPSER